MQSLFRHVEGSSAAHLCAIFCCRTRLDNLLPSSALVLLLCVVALASPILSKNGLQNRRFGTPQPLCNASHCCHQLSAAITIQLPDRTEHSLERQTHCLGKHGPRVGSLALDAASTGRMQRPQVGSSSPFRHGGMLLQCTPCQSVRWPWTERPPFSLHSVLRSLGAGRCERPGSAGSKPLLPLCRFHCGAHALPAPHAGTCRLLLQEGVQRSTYGSRGCWCTPVFQLQSLPNLRCAASAGASLCAHYRCGGSPQAM
jgi:hypothetical protein